MPRPSFDEYFMAIARLAAARSTCPRRHVGAVVVVDKMVVSTGYNGSLPGCPHCDDVGCELVINAQGQTSCVRTVHAETNALLQAAKRGVATLGSVIYCTDSPCFACFKNIAVAGVKEIVYERPYHEHLFKTLAEKAGMVVRKHG